MGSYNHKGNEMPMNVLQFNVGSDGKIKGRGTDTIGDHTWEGEVKKDDTFTAEKKYAKSTVYYWGTCSKSRDELTGQWGMKSGKAEDSFELRHNAAAAEEREKKSANEEEDEVKMVEENQEDKVLCINARAPSHTSYSIEVIN